MASKEFVVQQLLKAYRKGIISDELFTQQMAEIGAANGQKPMALASSTGQSAATISADNRQTSAGNGQQGSNKPGQGAPMLMRGITGDASIDSGALLTAMREKRTYDRTAEDLGNIVALEHVNVTVPDQDKATLFYINALGLTRDPYMMTGPANMWVNVGRQQFHLPTGKPQVVRGHVGVVIPDYEDLPRRLSRVRQALSGTRFECHEREGYIEATCPWGNRIRLYPPSERFGTMQLGLPYVEFDVPHGTADGITRFYSQIMGAQAATLEDGQGRFACVTAGNGQNLFFRETDRPIPPYDQHHVAIYINDFSGPHRRLKERGLIFQESDQHQYRFQDIVDPETGKVLFTIEHEVRSMKHPMYLRPLVNRNPSQTIMRYSPGEDALNWARAMN
jgi:predicted enzyme related to lactoylglutathione lyase